MVSSSSVTTTQAVPCLFLLMLMTTLLMNPFLASYFFLVFFLRSSTNIIILWCSSFPFQNCVLNFEQFSSSSSSSWRRHTRHETMLKADVLLHNTIIIVHFFSLFCQSLVMLEKVISEPSHVHRKKKEDPILRHVIFPSFAHYCTQASMGILALLHYYCFVHLTLSTFTIASDHTFAYVFLLK